MYQVLFAPDGKHYQVIKQSKQVGRMWNYFNFDLNIREQIVLNPQARFRLANGEFIIAELPKEKRR